MLGTSKGPKAIAMKRGIFGVLTIVLGVVAGCGGNDGDNYAAPKINVLSSDPSMVTGGDALVAVSIPAGATAGDVKVTLNGTDVTTQLKADATNGSLRGILSCLPVGSSTLAAQAKNGELATLAIKNHPIGGPVFSGPQATPWTCTTKENGLGDPLDAQCNAAPKYDFLYMSKAQSKFLPYDPANPPAASDIATTTTDQSVTMNYIVRRETGSANRGIYQIAVLFDPNKGWTALDPQSGWNGKVYVPLTGGFGFQNTSFLMDEVALAGNPVPGVVSVIPPVLEDNALRRGFMVAKNTLMQAWNSGDWPRGAESLMMLKERIIKRYGRIRYTFSNGGSGATMHQAVWANSYPGLLDGYLPLDGFPDGLSYTHRMVYDCQMLDTYFTKTSPALWADVAQRVAVYGTIDEPSCITWSRVFVRLNDPTVSDNGLPANYKYNPVTNPTGVRGVFSDYMVNYLGRRPESSWTPQEKAAGRGFGMQYIDNVGIQYGLGALSAGKISAEQFVDLNEKIGGLDIDYKAQAQRMKADPGVAERLYRAGFFNDVRQANLLPILSGQMPDPNISHDQAAPFDLRYRLQKAHGDATNHVIWLHKPGWNYMIWFDPAFAKMDQWLTSIEADKSADSRATKVGKNKPADLADGCWLPTAAAETLDLQTKDLQHCISPGVYPYHSSPRMVAAVNNFDSIRIVSCQLKPLQKTDYAVAFTDSQWARLQSAFPGGVCDYSKPDLADTPSVPWLTYQEGPGGKPLALSATNETWGNVRAWK